MNSKACKIIIDILMRIFMPSLILVLFLFLGALLVIAGGIFLPCIGVWYAAYSIVDPNESMIKVMDYCEGKIR